MLDEEMDDDEIVSRETLVTQLSQSNGLPTAELKLLQLSHWRSGHCKSSRSTKSPNHRLHLVRGYMKGKSGVMARIS